MKSEPRFGINTECYGAGSIIMAMDRSLNLSDRAIDVVTSEAHVFDHDAGHSNEMAFVLGWLMISIGLLAFTFYDHGAPSMNRDAITTGSITLYIEQPALPALPTTRP